MTYDTIYYHTASGFTSPAHLQSSESDLSSSHELMRLMNMSLSNHSRLLRPLNEDHSALVGLLLALLAFPYPSRLSPNRHQQERRGGPGSPWFTCYLAISHLPLSIKYPIISINKVIQVDQRVPRNSKESINKLLKKLNVDVVPWERTSSPH